MRSRATFIGPSFFASLLLCGLLAACSKKKEVTHLTSDPHSSYEPGQATKVSMEAGVTYVDVTKACGIDFRQESGAYGKKFLPETLGCGVGVLDYDGDGKPDLLFIQSCQWPEHRTLKEQPTMKLYKNLGNWHFKDVTKQAGLDVVCYGMGCSIADYDADGRPDIYVTCLGKNLLFHNDGGHFSLVKNGPDGGTWTDEKGKVHPSWSTGAAWFDADGDGDLDLVVVSYVHWTPQNDVYATMDGKVKSYTRPQLYKGDYPRLYLQQDDHTFVDATKQSGLIGPSRGKSLALCVDDFDNDGHLDFFVANDTVQNFLYLGDGKGHFREAARDAGVAYDPSGQARAAMGIDSTDWTNDGRIAIAIGNFSEEPVSLYRVARSGKGSLVFEDDAQRARIGRATLLPLTFGLLWADTDLDGWSDLILANGHIDPSVTRIKPEINYAQPPQLFRNDLGKRFVDVSAEAGAAFSHPMVGRGVVAADLDGDGDLDLVFSTNGAQEGQGRPEVLRCDLAKDNKNHSLRIRLRQPHTRNLDALGAVIHTTVGGMTERRVVRTGGSYLSQGELVATFGLGTHAHADKVTVTWPDGKTQDLGPLDAGYHEVLRKP